MILDGTTIFSDASEEFTDFIKAAYKSQRSSYPKFFKMDALSKLAFVASDVLLNAIPSEEKEENTAIILSNRASSLDTDRKHQKSIENKENYYPSPAVFVYTLPNICIGEISIKHKLFSENSFFIFENFNAVHLHDYASSLLNSGKAKKVLCGWVDFDTNKYDAFLYLVSPKGKINHSKEEINRLYRL